MTKNACMNDKSPKPIADLRVNKLERPWLDDANLLEKIEPHMLNVPMGDRSGVVIEPYLLINGLCTVNRLLNLHLPAFVMVAFDFP